MLRFLIPIATVLLIAGCDLTGDPSDDDNPERDQGAARTPAAPLTTPEVPEVCGTPVPAGPSTVALEVEGKQRSFELYVPSTYDAVDRHPLVFDFHGAGGSGAGQSEYSGIYEVADTGGFVVASPDADPVRRTWDFDGGDDADFVAAIVATVETRVCLDSARIYAMGFSDGATFANVLACEEGFNLAGIGIGGKDFVAGAAQLAVNGVGGLAGMARDARYGDAPAVEEFANRCRDRRHD